MTGEQMTAFMKLIQSASVKGRIADSPEGWEFLLGELAYPDCVAALRRFVTRPNPEGKRGPWINAVDIYEEVRRVRSERVERGEKKFIYSAFYPTQIDSEPDAVFAAREVKAKRAYIKAIADGDPEPTPKELTQRYKNPQFLLQNVFKSVKPEPRTLLTPGVKVELSPRQKALMRKRLES